MGEGGRVAALGWEVRLSFRRRVGAPAL